MKDIQELAQRAVGDVLNCLNSGVYVTDRERRIVFWNRLAEQVTGYAAEEVLGQRCSAGILQHTDRHGHPLCTTDLCPLYRSMVRAQPSDAPIIVYAVSKDGRRLALTTSTAPVFDDDGNVIGGVEVFREESESMRQMELARSVQRQMLTPELPKDERLAFAVKYAPRELVSGDFYHVRKLPDGRFAFFLADAAGHGVSAALSTSLIYALLMECQDSLGDPPAFLEELNRRACRRAPGLGFFTAVCSVVDPEGPTLTFSAAGHPPLLLCRAGTTTFEQLALPSLPAGLQEDAAYEARTVDLHPGDRALAYSDGATDIEVGAEQRLGVEGLGRLFLEHGPTDDANLTPLYGAIMERCATVEPDDDITLLSCRLCQ